MPAIVVEAVVRVGPSGGTGPRGWNLGYPVVPDQIFELPDLALLGDFDSAAAPAPVVAGALMVAQVREIDCSDFVEARPAFLTVVVMPFTYSTVNGIGAGFVSRVLLHAVTGRMRGIHPLMWVVAAAFALYFVVGRPDGVVAAC